MEIKNYHQEAQVSGVTSNSFGFEMNAKMYDILISKMYTNKPGAVIRELSANAWDAHVEAGKVDTPFDLHLPTWLDKSFYIRDYGTGIPHEKFEHIYTNVGASTKEDTNDLIGGFGLGSKTPFTMTDTFIVENWRDGRKTTWACFKDKGEPQVSMVADELSTEASGLKVSFSFDEGDVPEFTKQVVKQLKFFPVKPNVTGGEGSITFEELPDGWDTQTYFYKNSSIDNPYGIRSNYVVMGNVAYVLDSSEFDYKLRGFFSRGLTIRAPIGAVDIPPSREHLEMTSRTKSYILAVLDTIKKEYQSSIQSKLDACKKDMEVRRVVYDLNNEILNNPKELLWKGQELDWHAFRVSYVTHVAGYLIKCISRGYKNVYRATKLSVRSLIDKKHSYYVNDLGTGFSKHINDNYHNYDTSNMVIFHIDGSTSKDKDERVKKAIAILEEELDEEVKLLSSVFGFPLKATKVQTTGQRLEPNQVFKVPATGITSTSSFSSQLLPQTDLPQDGYYMELSNWTIKSLPKLNMRVILGCSDFPKFLDKPLYVIRSKTIPKLDKSMVPLDEKVIKSLKGAIVTKYKQGVDRKLLHSVTSEVSPTYKYLLPAIKDKKLKVFIRYCCIFNYNRNPINTGELLTLHNAIFSKSIDYQAKLPSKVEKLNAKIKPYINVVEQISCRWSESLNTERMGDLVQIIIDN